MPWGNPDDMRTEADKREDRGDQETADLLREQAAEIESRGT
jgi:DNA-binding ferritin-like protein